MKAFLVYWAELTSAATTTFVLNLLGEPAWHQGNIVHLDNASFEIAPGCCGPNAGLALITTAIGLALFLKSNRNRAILILLAIPLSILRNGIRIATIALLCKYVGPHMIHSWIHTHGGPLFFLVALVQLLLTYRYLAKIWLRYRPLP